MSHRFAVLVIVATTLMWSISGLITRYLDKADGFEAVFWRSLFASLLLVGVLSVLRGPAGLLRGIGLGGGALWLSAICWALMFTAFVLALMHTNVANVLVTIALSPLLTALLARVAIGYRLPARTSLAILLAGAGVVWMYAGEIAGTDTRNLAGMAISLVIPMAAAINLTLLQYVARHRTGIKPDMLLAVLLGASMAALASLPLSFPFDATLHDTGLLAVMGTLALAIPCLLLVAVSRVLSAPEISLYSLLEIVFGVSWVWLAVNETPSQAVVVGGCIVLGALVLNEVLATREPALVAQSP
jgi:drug/metabolite transporter (DMT)-like permease